MKIFMNVLFLVAVATIPVDDVLEVVVHVSMLKLSVLMHTKEIWIAVMWELLAAMVGVVVAAVDRHRHRVVVGVGCRILVMISKVRRYQT